MPRVVSLLQSLGQGMLAPPQSSADVIGQCVWIAGLNQLAGLLIFDFGHDSAGQPLQVSLVNPLMLQIPLYACGLFAPMALWSLANAAFPRWQRFMGCRRSNSRACSCCLSSYSSRRWGGAATVLARARPGE